VLDYLTPHHYWARPWLDWTFT